LAKCFGLTVGWNAATRGVTLSGLGNAPRADVGVYVGDDLYWLARIIQAEAGGEPFEGKIAVGNVVLNRVRSAEFPSTVYGVIFDRKFGVQFTPTANGSIYCEPSLESVIAARICLEGYTLSDQALYFFNPRTAGSSWIAKHRPYAFRIGNHAFYK
jgi:N-acetylmuramoyl-L-alanine amidase